MAIGWEGSAGKLKGKCEKPEKKKPDVLVEKLLNNHSGDKENEDKEKGGDS